MNKIEPRLLKGFRDYGPDEQMFRQEAFLKIQTVFERFGFLPLSTPVLEYKDILTGKYGEDEKLIYSFKDNGDREVAMRYDLTVPLARYVAQNQNELTLPFKRYQIAPVWRADNPQKGRLREFYQCDVDAVGTDSVMADAEVIACLAKAIEAVGITDYQIRINDRSVLQLFSVETIRVIDKVDKIGLDKVVAELKEKGIEQSQIDQVQTLLTDPSKTILPERLQQVINLIKGFGIPENKIVFSPSIARGLDYYSGTVFETILTNQPEFGSICSGGRYDNLVDTFSEKSLPAVGGSIGIDRLFDAMRELKLVQSTRSVKALVVHMDETLQADYLKLVSDLRDGGINSELYYQPAKLDKQFKYAENKGIQYAILMGQDEKGRGVVKIKNIQTREQQEISLPELIKTLQ